MNTRLKHIHNWAELAKEAKWSAAALAKKCGVSVRTLHRHFQKQTRNNTKSWLAEQRHRRAVELLCGGSSIKETAFRVGYKQPTNFTRQYKNLCGASPSMQSRTIINALT